MNRRARIAFNRNQFSKAFWFDDDHLRRLRVRFNIEEEMRDDY
jgi:hypothetical protein